MRPGFRNAPKYYRTNKAVSTLRAFLKRHMKADEKNIRIGQHLNELLWKHGIKNPPARVIITVKMTDDGLVFAELLGKEFKASIKPMAKSEEPQGLKEKLQSVVGKKETPEASTEEAPVAEQPVKPKKVAKKTAKKAES